MTTNIVAQAQLEARQDLEVADGFDGGEVLLVVVAVAADSEVIHAGTTAQAQGMAAKHFAGEADEAELIGQQNRGHLRAHGFAVFTLVKGHQSRKKD